LKPESHYLKIERLCGVWLLSFLIDGWLATHIFTYFTIKFFLDFSYFYNRLHEAILASRLSFQNQGELNLSTNYKVFD
jgi:hypothetical protein